MTYTLDFKPCHYCHAPIAWERTKNGKRTPINPDGTPHWATCRNQHAATAAVNAALDRQKLERWNASSAGKPHNVTDIREHRR